MLRFKALSRSAKGWNVHHIVPLQSLTIAELGPFLGYALKGGFSLGSFDDNGILLPSTEQNALATGLPLHRGSHPNYNRGMIDYLKVVAGPISATLSSDADAVMAAHFLRKVVCAKRNNLTALQGADRLSYVNDMIVQLPMDRDAICDELARHRARGRSQAHRSEH